MQKNIIIIFGPQGSGKGTQADLLAKKTGFKKISTGDLFRAELAAKTSVGKLADKYIKAGKLVPDRIVYKLVEKSLKQKTTGFIFDGFPRNMEQLKKLLEMFKKVLKKNDQVFALEIAVSDKEARERIGNRRMCVCGAVYHLVYNPPISDGLCDICGEKLFIRNDDKPKVIIRRLKIYHKQGRPILDYFKKQGKLIKIDGERPIKKIHEDIIEKLKALKLI